MNRQFWAKEVDMSEYRETDLPVELGDGEILYLDSGSSIRFESNGEAKDVFFGDSFERDVELFPDCDYVHQVGGNQYRLLALMDSRLRVEKV